MILSLGLQDRYFDTELSPVPEIWLFLLINFFTSVQNFHDYHLLSSTLVRSKIILVEKGCPCSGHSRHKGQYFSILEYSIV